MLGRSNQFDSGASSEVGGCVSRTAFKVEGFDKPIVANNVEEVIGVVGVRKIKRLDTVPRGSIVIEELIA